MPVERKVEEFEKEDVKNRERITEREEKKDHKLMSSYPMSSGTSCIKLAYSLKTYDTIHGAFFDSWNLCPLPSRKSLHCTNPFARSKQIIGK